MNRRGFLGAMLAAGVAPAIVRADSLMRIVPRDVVILPVMEIGRIDRFTIIRTPSIPGGVLTADVSIVELRKIVNEFRRHRGFVNVDEYR